MAVPTTVQEVALGVIADIEKYGHYQNLPGQLLSFQPRKGERCCVVANPTMRSLWVTEVPGGYELDWDFRKAFLDAACLSGTASVAAVSDCLDTDEVLDILWAVALG